MNTLILAITFFVASSASAAGDNIPPVQAPAAVQAPALRLYKISAPDQELLKKLGLLGLRVPNLGPRSYVYNLKTGQDMTAAELKRIKDGASPELQASQAFKPSGPDQKGKDAPALDALKQASQEKGASEPMGLLPSEYSGTLRGPAMSADNASVLKANKWSLRLDGRADNFLTREWSPNGTVAQKFENHTIGMEARYGLKTKRPVELGLGTRVHERDQGFLNGFIAGFEGLMSGLFGPDAVNPDRTGSGALTGTANRAELNGRSLSNDNGKAGWALGDVSLSAKAALTELKRGSPIPGLAARLAVNIATGGKFGTVSSAGAGLSMTQPLYGGLYAHGDLRVTAPLASEDRNGLALSPAALGASVGLEAGLGRNTSIGLQLNHQQSPYKKTGLHSYDDGYTDITFGISHKLMLWSRKVVVQVWGKEDFNTNSALKGANGAQRGALTPHGDTDFSTGITITFSK